MIPPGQTEVPWGTSQDRTAERVLAVKWSACLLRSCRRTFLFQVIYYRPHPKDGEGNVFTLSTPGGVRVKGQSSQEGGVRSKVNLAGWGGGVSGPAGGGSGSCALLRAVCLLRSRRRTFLFNINLSDCKSMTHVMSKFRRNIRGKRVAQSVFTVLAFLRVVFASWCTSYSTDCRWVRMRRSSCWRHFRRQTEQAQFCYSYSLGWYLSIKKIILKLIITREGNVFSRVCPRWHVNFDAEKQTNSLGSCGGDIKT